MFIKKVNSYDSTIENPVSNEYPTKENSFKQPCLHLIVGQRTSGKSYLTSKILAQTHKDKTFDRIYIITPSFNSNKSYFGKYIKEEDVFDPTKDSITKVIEGVEADRDAWEAYLQKEKDYKKFKSEIHDKKIHISDEDVITYMEHGFFDKKKPEWKYKSIEPPKSLLIMDDVLGSPAILQSSGLTRIATLNRHMAPLEQNHSNRSACGLAVIILCQSYKMQSGISRVLRENVSLLTLFKNKQEKQLEAIKDELANVVDVECFNQAYETATSEKHGSLTIDFTPKTPCKTFRKNLNEFIVFDKLGGCDCK
tara:strand:+ start:250 stop:1176 length:927 start_codon:yes stop_codon:yes gene_type:complete